MGKKASLSQTKRAQIVILRKEGLFKRKICIKVTLSNTAVYQAIARFQNFGLYHDKKRSGRPRKTSSLDDNLIWQIAV